MSRGKISVLTVAQDDLVGLANTRFAIQQQLVPYQWWIVDLSENEETKQVIKSWGETDFISTITLRNVSDPNQALNKIFPMISDDLVMNIEVGYRLKPLLMQYLMGYMRFNRDKQAAYAPFHIRSDPAVFGSRTPPEALPPVSCVLFDRDALAATGEPWPDPVQRFTAMSEIWPCVMSPMVDTVPDAPQTPQDGRSGRKHLTLVSSTGSEG